MTLTSDQIQQIKDGSTVRVSAPEVGADCVVLRADVYQRVQALLDDGLSAAEVGRLVERNMADDDALDPLLDSYQHYRR
jgi:hypothetical protein